MTIYRHTFTMVVTFLPNFTIGAGAIAGGVIGGVVLILTVILVIAMLGFLVLRRKTIPGMCFTHVERKCLLDVACIYTMRLMQGPRFQHPKHPVQGKQVVIWAVLI